MVTPTPAVGGRGKSAVAAAGLAVAVAVINLVTMPGMLYVGDPVNMRQEARSLLLRGRLSVDNDLAEAVGERGQYYVLNASNGRHYSKYGVMNSLMFMPPLLVESAFSPDLSAMTGERMLLILNLYNVALSVLIALLLYRVAGLYSRGVAARVTYVLTAFYATFLWNYLRAQTGEIFQVLFFTGMAYHGVRYARSLTASADGPMRCRWSDLALCWAFVAALCLTKVSFLLLLAAPWILTATALAAATIRPAPARVARIAVLGLLGPSLAVAAAVGSVNWAKFGAPWLSGYHQWQPHTATLNGEMFGGVYGFLFNIQKSIFVHFPLLVLALAGLRAFFDRYRSEALALGAIFVLNLAVLGKLPSWRGEWCYGPRYLLFLLPVLAVPYVLVLERVFTAADRPDARVGLLASVLVLAPSVMCQTLVNRMDFFAYYYIRTPIENNVNMAVADYLLNNHFAKIYADFTRLTSGPDSLPYIRELKGRYPPEFIERYTRNLLAMRASPNYYWPDWGSIGALRARGRWPGGPD